MTFQFRPEIQARLEAHAAALGIPVDAYLEALVEKELVSDPEAREFTGGQFQKEYDIWVYRTGVPMPLWLADDTLDAVRREREVRSLADFSGENIS